jgi:type IV pilus secretin PilQ/predicted competence protein
MKKTAICLVAWALFLHAGVFAQEVSSNIKSLLSKDGKVIYGNEPNSIIVFDYPQNLDRVQEYISLVDVVPRQVLIEARVVEVRLSREHSLGVNWALFADKGGFKMGQFRVNSAGGASSLAQAIPAKPIYNTPGQSTSGAVSPFTVTIFDENLNVVLSAIASDLDTDILSAPRITTVNNRQAEIKIIQSYPWAEPQVDTSGESGVVSITWTVHFEEIGILLKVNPMITEEGTISMDLSPEISEKVDDLPLVVEGITYKVPIIDKRSASTKVVVGNGQTLIIGGLIKDKTTYNRAKVPIVGDIPVLGYLFKSQKTTKEKVELLIFVSPTIVNANEVARMGNEYRYGVGNKYSKEAAAKRSRLERAMEKEEALNDRKINELDELLRQRSEMESGLLQQEADVKQLQLKRDELVQLRKLLEMR